MKTIYEQILEVVEQYNKYGSLKPVVTSFYRSKTNPDVIINVNESELAEAFKAGKSLTDYDFITEKVSPKEDLYTAIFGETKVITLYDLQQFVLLSEALTGKKIDFIGKAPQIKGKKPKSEYATTYATLTAAIKSYKDKDKKEKESAKRLERVMLIIDSKRPPKSTFSDMELYNTTIKSLKETKEN